jgi:hypothetical protein
MELSDQNLHILRGVLIEIGDSLYGRPDLADEVGASVEEVNSLFHRIRAALRQTAPLSTANLTLSSDETGKLRRSITFVSAKIPDDVAFEARVGGSRADAKDLGDRLSRCRSDGSR